MNVPTLDGFYKAMKMRETIDLTGEDSDEDGDAISPEGNVSMESSSCSIESSSSCIMSPIKDVDESSNDEVTNH